MSAAGSDSDAETVITEGTIEREKGSKEKETLGKVSEIPKNSVKNTTGPSAAGGHGRRAAGNYLEK